MQHNVITEKIIRAFFNVYNNLGYGFLEKVYENSMIIELQKLGCIVEKQKNIKVLYDGKIVGEYYVDLLVDDKVMIELKAAENLCREHEAQLLNYLKSTNIEIGLLLNFGKKAEIRRKIYTNDRK